MTIFLNYTSNIKYSRMNEIVTNYCDKLLLIINVVKQ